MAVFVQNSRIAALASTALILAGAAMAEPAKHPERIVSTSLCGDAYVLSLAEPSAITALSWQADTRLSAAPQALRIKNHGFADAERLVVLNPDLIVLGPGDAPRAVRGAQKRGADVIAINWVEDFAGIYTNLEALGSALGQREKAQMRIGTIKARLKALAQRKPPHPFRVLYLTPNGTSAGAGVFVDAAIRAAGGINHGARLGVIGWGKLPLEKLSLDPPDLILTSFFDEGYASVSNLRIRHPLLRQALKDVPTAAIAAKHWVCAGPGLVDATEDIAAALGALRRENDS